MSIGTAAVGIQDLGRHALREHVLGGRQRVRNSVAVDVDEARRDVQAGRVDFGQRGRMRQIADRRDAVAGDRDVGLIGRHARAVEERAMPDDDVELRRIVRAG